MGSLAQRLAAVGNAERTMGSFPFLKLDEPSSEEMEAAVKDGHEVVAISSINDPDHMFLKLLCRNGDEAVIWLDAFLVDHLARHFERLLHGGDRHANHPICTKFVGREGTSLGTVPRDGRP
jgi:hypothetical protein